MHIKVGRTTIEIQNADFTKIQADCLIFPSNNYLWMGNEITSMIKRFAGEDVEKEALAQAPVNPPNNAVTCGGKLRFNFLIHSVCMLQDGKINEENLSQSVISALGKIEQIKCKTAVLIPFFLKNSGISIFKTAEFTIDACINYCMKKNCIEKISITGSDPQTITPFIDYLTKKFSLKK